MKKTLLLMILLGLLAGCGTEIKAETKNADEEVLKVAEVCAKSFTDGLAYSLSQGLRIVDCSSDKLLLSTDAVYQLYRGENLTYFLLEEDKEVSVIGIDEKLAEALKQECAFVRIDGTLILVSGESEIALEEGKVITQDMKDKINQLRSKKIRVNLSTIKRKDLEFKIDNPDSGFVNEGGSRYNTGRIIIRFAEGDRSKYIEDYCNFCGGRLIYSMRYDNVFVFGFEEKSVDQLKDLQKRSEELDYVISASFDGNNELH